MPFHWINARIKDRVGLEVYTTQLKRPGYMLLKIPTCYQLTNHKQPSTEVRVDSLSGQFPLAGPKKETSALFREVYDITLSPLGSNPQ